VSHQKKLRLQCLVNVLNFKIEQQDTKIDLLRNKLDKKDTLLEKKDALIDDLRKEFEVLRLSVSVGSLVMPAPPATYQDPYHDNATYQDTAPMVSQDQGPAEMVSQDQGAAQCNDQWANQAHEAAVDILLYGMN